VNAGNQDGMTPLIAAAAMVDSRHPDMRNPSPKIADYTATLTKLLLDKGADVFARSKEGDTAISIAQKQKNTAALPLLLAARQRQLNEARNKPAAEQFEIYLNALLDSPSDDTLREEFLRDAAARPTLPPIPEEARQFASEASQKLKAVNTSSDLELPISLLRKALDIAPWWRDAYFNLAYALQAASRYDESIQELNYYLELNPPEADAAKARARLKVLETEKESAPSR
jgi:ankyrin repeat protein